MIGYICVACGLQHPDGESPPSRCAICEDDRQFVPPSGQRWTTPEALAAEHANAFREAAPALIEIATAPTFAIGQRAFLVRASAGNVLWDCLSLLDRATVEIIRALGGLTAIALSHPHYYSVMASWGRAFDCPVLAHAADRDWVVRPDPCVEFWEGDSRDVLPGVTLHRLGGHFPGASVLHWAERRALLASDTALATPDRRHVSFMWSYPNRAPLSAATVERIGERLAALDFDAVYGAFRGGEIERDAKAAVARSVARHVGALGEPRAGVARPA